VRKLADLFLRAKKGSFLELERPLARMEEVVPRHWQVTDKLLKTNKLLAGITMPGR
jgi:hypothetical protein